MLNINIKMKYCLLTNILKLLSRKHGRGIWSGVLEASIGISFSTFKSSLIHNLPNLGSLIRRRDLQRKIVISLTEFEFREKNNKRMCELYILYRLNFGNSWNNIQYLLFGYKRLNLCAKVQISRFLPRYNSFHVSTNL